MSRRRRQRRKLVGLLTVAFLAAGLGVLGHATHLLRRSELQSIDARFSVRGKQNPPQGLVLVAINPSSLVEMRNHELATEVPLPRRYDAKVIDNLRIAGAKVIAVDLEFSRTTDVADDNALFEAIGRAHGKTVLGTIEVGPGGRTAVLGGPESLQSVQARVGYVGLPEDSDGAIRRFPYSYRAVKGFGVAAAELATGRRVSQAGFEKGNAPIDFAGPNGSVSSIPYYRALTGHFPASTVRGKIVVIGATAKILQDIHPTATSGGMPGPEIQVNAIATLLRGIPLRNASGWVNILLIIILGVAVPLTGLRTRRWRSLILAPVLAVLFTVAVQVAFNSGRIVTFVYPLLALALGTLGTLAVLFVGETIEREHVRDIFARFVPGGVVDEVLASAGDNLRLGGVERECTVLFSDLRGFTSFSETQPAARVIEVVNHYLNEMTEAILAAGGTLIAYMGDGIMAVFGTPLEQDDHADRAVRAAREMIGLRLDRFNSWLREQGFDRTFEMGVGLHSGMVMAGNVGSEQRVEYTAIGDTTNTASRLEGMTKNSDAMLFVSESTRSLLRDEVADLEPVGEFEIRGRTSMLAVWTIWPPGTSERDRRPVDQRD
jgi:adenylate cyclase